MDITIYSIDPQISVHMNGLGFIKIKHPHQKDRVTCYQSYLCRMQKLPFSSYFLKRLFKGGPNMILS